MAQTFIFLLIALIFSVTSTHALDTSSCKAISDPLSRLSCFDHVASAMSEINWQHVVLDVLNSPAALAAILAAIFALLTGISGPVVQLRIGKRQAAASQTSANAAMLTAQNTGTREIARLRLSWMDKLRDTLSEYHSILMSTEHVDAKAQKLSELGTQLDLLLNRDDKFQKDSWDITDKIYRAESLHERQSYDEALIGAGRAVFKAEWEKIKAEMRGEPFQRG